MSSSDANTTRGKQSDGYRVVTEIPVGDTHRLELRTARRSFSAPGCIEIDCSLHMYKLDGMFKVGGSDYYGARLARQQVGRATPKAIDALHDEVLPQIGPFVREACAKHGLPVPDAYVEEAEEEPVAGEVPRGG